MDEQTACACAPAAEHAPRTLRNANAMPAPTWHRLQASEADIELPDLPCATARARFACDAPGAAGDFDAAMAAAQTAWLAAHPEPYLTTAMIDEGKDPDAVYGGTALSRYQKRSDEIGAAKNVVAAFETGIGPEAFDYMRARAGEPYTVTAQPGEKASCTLHMDAQAGACHIAALDVVARAGSELEVNISVDSPEDGVGVVGTSLRVFAGEGARVRIVRTQSLDAGWIDLDDMGLFTAPDARIDVRQTVLGAAHAFTGLAGDLRGTASRMDVDTRYLGTGTRALDFNYSLRHHGPKTQCTLTANGVLAGSSKKTLRGTIDLVRGCKGAAGQETETVLLVDEDVENKTVPVILCNEDDVAGNHGATIGHVRAEQLFYLSSRGLSERAAEQMFLRALVEQAALDAPDEASRAGVVRLGDTMLDGFSSLLDWDAVDAGGAAQANADGADGRRA